MSYKEDQPNTSSASSKNNSSESRVLASVSVLGKRQEKSISDKPDQDERKKKKEKTSKYKGVCSWSPRCHSFRAQLMAQRTQLRLGTFELQADAAQAYDRALRLLQACCLLPPRTRRANPNFANEEEYQAARQDEIRVKHGELKSQLRLESFAEQFSPKFLSEAQLRDKLGLPPAPPPAGESLLTPTSHIPQTDSHNDQGSRGHDDENTLSSASSDNEADARKAKVPRVSPESKPPNNDKNAVKEELIIDLVSSDEEDSVKVKEEIVDSRVVQSREANPTHSDVAENQPSPEMHHAHNDVTAVQGSVTIRNQNDSHLVLKKPLMQILKVQYMTDAAMENEIEEYCKTLFKEKRCWNEKYLETKFLKGLSEKKLEEMFDFMQPLEIEMVKQWARDL